MTNLGDEEGRSDAFKAAFALIGNAFRGKASFLTRVKIEGLERCVDLRILVLERSGWSA